MLQATFYSWIYPIYSVVEFAHRSDMEYALRKLDDADLNGQRIRLFEVCKFKHPNFIQQWYLIIESRIVVRHVVLVVVLYHVAVLHVVVHLAVADIRALVLLLDPVLLHALALLHHVVLRVIVVAAIVKMKMFVLALVHLKMNLVEEMIVALQQIVAVPVLLLLVPLLAGKDSLIISMLNDVMS